MTESDRSKWQQKYRDSDPLSEIDPDEELLRYAEHLPNSGKALDLACGRGKNSLYLAQRGLTVTAADISQNGLDRLMQAARSLGLENNIQPLCVDLDEHSIEQSCFDLVVVVRFLNRELFASIQAALKPGGILLYKTFNRRVLETRPGFNRDFTIETEELLAAFNTLEVIADNREDHQGNCAFLLARRPQSSG